MYIILPGETNPLLNRFMHKGKTKILNNWPTLTVGLVLSIIIILIFGGITKTFYQQDEWLGYGLYLAKGPGMIMQSTGGILGIIFGQGRILTNLLHFLFYKYSPLNVLPIAVFAITLHIINTLIVFFLAKKLFKKILPAFLGSLFFALNSVSQSAVTWPAASINTLPSTALILIALIFYFRYLESFKEKWMILSFVFVYLSLFFKETGVFLFLILPLFSVMYRPQNIRTFIRRYWYYLLATFLIVSFRIWGFKSEPGQVALFLTGSSQAYWQTLLTRAVLYPLTSFSLTFVPSEPFLWFARSLSKIYYPFIMPQQFILIAQTVVLDLLALGLTFIIFILIYFLAMRSAKAERKHIGFFVGFMLFSFLPYIVIGKSYAYLESRYFYLPTFAAAMIIAWFAKKIFEKVKAPFLKLLFFLLLVYFLGVHFKYLENNIAGEILISQERKSFLSQLSKRVPNLSQDKNVFFITSDRNYYVEGNKIPFQQGTGYTLMAWFYSPGKIPQNLLKEGYLYDIGAQGYREEDGRGFGYFFDTPALMAAAKDNKFDKKSIYALSYDSKKQVLLDITGEIRALFP